MVSPHELLDDRSKPQLAPLQSQTGCFFALSQGAERVPHLWLDTTGPKWMNSPLPWGEGVPLPALSPAGAGRVRGHLHGESRLSF